MFIKKLLFLWNEQDKFGFINQLKEIIIPCEYEQFSEMINDMVWLKKNHSWKLINHKNQIIIDNIDNLIDYNGELSIVQKNQKFLLIDHINNNQKEFTDGIIPININENKMITIKKNGLFGFLNSDLSINIDATYSEVNKFCDNKITVKKNNKWGMIDQNNNIIIDFKYDYLSPKCDGYIKAKIQNKTFFIDKNENQYLIQDFLKNYNFHEFSELMLGFEYKGKKGYMNQFFEIEILKKFDEIHEFKNNCAIIKIKNKYGAILKNGKYILKPIYDSIIYYDDISFLVKKENQYLHILKNGNHLF